jgi:hypothetical protein
MDGFCNGCLTLADDSSASQFVADKKDRDTKSPDVKGDDFQPLLPTRRRTDLGKETLVVLSPALIGFKLGLNDSGDHIVTVMESLFCQGNAHRRVSRCYQPRPGTVVSRKLRSRERRGGTIRHS